MSICKKYYDPIKKRGVLSILGFIELTKIQNPIKELKQQILTLHNIINSIFNIEKVPSANGILREHQLSCLELLKEIDSICKNNNLQYFLSFGTLLGAKRHHGFIPWDNDIDISMLRGDYNKILKILQQHYQNSDYIVRENVSTHFQIKIHHKDNEELGIDIFPLDSYYKSSISTKEKEKLNIRIKNAMVELGRKHDKLNLQKNRRIIDKLTKKIMKNNQPCEKPLLFYGIDYPHSHSDIVFDYSSVFPLSTISFEGYDFPCPNNVDTHLRQLYNDYMSFPTNCFIDR